MRRIGQRPTVFAGVACVGLGLLPLGFTGIDTPVLVVAALLVLEGVGQGLLTVAYTDIVTATLPARDRGVAGSLSLLTRTIGIVAGASVLTALQAHGAAGLHEHGRLPRRLPLRLRGGGRRTAGAFCCSRSCGPAPGPRSLAPVAKPDEARSSIFRAA